MLYHSHKKYALKSDLKFSNLKTEKFIYDGNSIIASSASIADDGFCNVFVNGVLWSSRTGKLSFLDGNISINFLTGVISFEFAPQIGDHIIIKYN